MSLRKRFVLLEGDASWQDKFYMLARWDSPEVEEGQISIPLSVEEKAVDIKSDYLRAIFEIGAAQVEGKLPSEHLKLFDNLSLWWMTAIVEKSPFIYESVYKIFKLRALEKLYLEQGCSELVYCGSDSTLHEVLSAWCARLGHPYRNISVKEKSKGNVSFSMRKLFFDRLPCAVQVFAWLVRRWWMRFRHSEGLSGGSLEKSSKDEVTVVTFFPNIDLDKASQGKFYSRYWEKLHDSLDRSEKKINWVWFYFPDKELSFQQAGDLKNIFNQNSGENQKIFLLEDFLNFRALLKCLRLYLKIYFCGRRLSQIKEAFFFSGSKMNFFPFLKKDWDSSIFGIMAIERIVQGVMFDSMASYLPASLWTLYTWENQPWEFALISALRRHSKRTRIIAYEHSSIRPLDMRIFMDPETYKDSSVMAMPVPDILGINGSAGLSAMQGAGFPVEKIKRIEALRFFNLSERYGLGKKAMKASARTLIVVTGVIPQEAYFQLKLLDEVFQQGGLDKYEKILIKPHPALSLDSLLHDLGPVFKYNMVSGPINKYWSQVDVVYCANSSGAALEAAWLGIPLIITSAGDAMNLNPLFGLKGLSFVSDVSSLSRDLSEPQTVEIPDDYFFLDETLESWEKLLGI